VKRHLALVPVAEVVHHVGGPLVGLGQQHAVGVVLVHLAPHPPQVGVRLLEVLAVGAVALEQVGDRVEPEPVQSQVEPEAQHVEHRLLHLGLVVVQVRLVVEEAVPVVGAGLLVPGPVRGLGIDEDDARVLVALLRVRPDVPVALRRVGARAGLLEPGVVHRGVVHDEVGDDAHPALVGLIDEAPHVLDHAVVLVDREEVGDVVAAVPQRRLVHRQQPDAVHAEPLQVIELLGEAAEVPGAVAVAVVEAAQVDLVEDRGLEPERLGLEPVLGLGAALRLRRLWRGRGRHASTRSRCAMRSPGPSRT
jgi:hypothetical protein